jgi:hypothetical protein
MFGKLVNSIKQGGEAAKAAAVIQQISGIQADELMIANLRSRAQINQQSFISMNAHEYAFEVMFTYYVDLKDSYPNLRKKSITRDHPLRKKIIESFDIFVAMGVITNSYIIDKYESAKSDPNVRNLSQESASFSESDKQKVISGEALKHSTNKKVPPLTDNAVPTEGMRGIDSKDVTSNSRRFSVNEKVVPKGTPAFSEPQKTAPQQQIQVREKTADAPDLLKNQEKKSLSKVHCPSCLVEISRSKLLKSKVGAGWKECPFCEMNFQL